jgi:hypothetical protein
VAFERRPAWTPASRARVGSMPRRRVTAAAVSVASPNRRNVALVSTSASVLYGDRNVPAISETACALEPPGLFGCGGVLPLRPLLTVDSAAAPPRVRPLPFCSARRITARSRRGAAAGPVTLALAVRDQRLREPPPGSAIVEIAQGEGKPKGNPNPGNGRRGRTGERRTKGNQRKAGDGGEPGGQTGNRRKARRGNRRT